MKQDKCQKSKVKNIYSRGALLLEILIVVALLAIILGVGSQAVFVSMQSSKVSGERDSAIGLASEALEAARAVTEEKWQNIYTLTSTTTPVTTHYRVATTTVGWTIAMGNETISLNNALYTRYLTIENVCRSTAGREVTGSGTSCAGGSALDPSTQKITAFVSWRGGDTVALNEYFFRWKNKVCAQTDWSGGAGSGAKNCPDTSYGSAESSISTAGGILKLQ